MPIRIRPLATVTLAALALTACGDDATAPEAESPAVAAQVSADVAAQAADAAAEDVQVMRVNTGAFGIATLDYERFTRWAPCPLDAGTNRFTCASAGRGPWTANRSWQFRDASGAPQPAYDATTTASANFRWTLAGTFERRRWEGTTSRERDLTFGGLAGANTTVTVNGTGSDARSRTRFANPNAAPGSNAAADRSYEMAATLRIENVVIPVPRADAWPTSGSITRTFTGTRTAANRTATVRRTATVTFNGTALVPLVVNGNRFTLDLATGEITPASGA